MATLIDVEKVIDFCGVDGEEDGAIVTAIHKSIEAWVNSYCNDTLLTGNYAEYYDGNGEQYIQLDHYPITGLTRVAEGRRTAIRIQNTDDYTTASISVTSTGIILTKNGTSNSTITFALYATMTTLVAAINALGLSWSAVVESTDYSNFDSGELVQVFGKSAIHDNWVYLDMPEEACDDFEVYPNRGEIYKGSGWHEGHNNIYAEYTAGQTTCPADLELAIEMWVQYIYQRHEDNTVGVKAYSLGDISVTFDNELNEIPNDIKLILNKYRRILI